jgi:hypothetical protein
MSYACPAWEFAADTNRMSLHSLQNKVGKFPRRTPVLELHMAFQEPYIYDYVMKLCMR